MQQTPKRIGMLLVEEGLITPGDLKEALEVQRQEGTRIVATLMAMGRLRPRDFVNFMARRPGVASIDIHQFALPKELTDLVPREFAVRHELIPLDRLGKLLTVAMVCPLDTRTIEELERITGLHVRPLLASPEDVRRAIERHYGAPQPEEQATTEAEEAVVEEAKIENLRLLLHQLDALPALPATLRELREALDSDDVSSAGVARIIENDPPLAAKLLGVANSIHYGFSNRVTTVELAVTLLGVREVYDIALSVCVADLMHASRTFNYKAFWTSSMLCAALARRIAQATGNARMRGVYAAALLLDIGRVALAEVAPDLYAQVPQTLEGEERIAAEENVLGIAHPEAGFLLADGWSLPYDLAEAVRFHHRPEYARQPATLVHIVSLADRYARAA